MDGQSLERRKPSRKHTGGDAGTYRSDKAHTGSLLLAAFDVLCVLPVQMACWTRPVFRLMLVTTPETRGFVLWGVQRSRCSGGLCNRAVDVPGATRVRATRGWSASAP